MKVALKSVFPSIFAATVLTLGLAREGAYVEVSLATIWTIFYGLALLGTSHFSPKSITLLGWSFLVLGLLSFLGVLFGQIAFDTQSATKIAAAIMGIGFGGLHLLYAACTWPRTSRSHLETSNV